MEVHISATEAARTFPDMIERVRAHHEVFVIERAGESICRIGPMAPPQRTVRDLVRLLQAAPRPDDGYLDAVEEIANNQPALPETPIGAHDLLIAATALAVGYDVATRDERSFPKVPGLNVLRW